MENDKEKNSDSMFDELSSDNTPSMFDNDALSSDSTASMFDNDTLKPDENSDEVKQDVNSAEEETKEPENKSEDKIEDKKSETSDKNETSEPEDIKNNLQNSSTTADTGVITEDTEEDENSSSLVTVRPVKFKEFEQTPPHHVVKKNYDIMLDVPLHISVELGRTKSTIKDVIDLTKGSIVELNKIAGEQVEIYVNDKFVAKGEVIVIEDRFGVRVTNTNIQKNTANL